MRKTPKEVAAEIATLKEYKPNVRRFSAFGDDNREKVQIQIDVLEGKLDSVDIDELSGDDDCDLYGVADEARQWLNGETPEAPHEGWKCLLPKGPTGGFNGTSTFPAAKKPARPKASRSKVGRRA